MFGAPYNWPRQDWRVNPAPMASAAERPVSINSAAFLKRGLAQEILAAGTCSVNGTSNQEPKSICHVDIHQGNPEDAELDYDDLIFEDMYGNVVDGTVCDIIYDDVSEVKLLIDEDGNVEYMHEGEDWEHRVMPVTTTSTELMSEPTTEAAKPNDPISRLPVKTTDSGRSSGTFITEPPELPTE